MIGCRGQERSPFSLEAILSGIEILGLIGSMYDSERIGSYDWKLQCALIVGHEVITPVFWFRHMDIDTFNCSRVGRKVRSDVCLPALTCSLLENMSCIIVLSWSLVTDTHPRWHLSWPQPHRPCWGFRLHPFIRTLCETSSEHQRSPSANSHTMESREGTSQPLQPWPSVQPYLSPFSLLQFVMGCLLQGWCLTRCHLESRPHKHRGVYTISHLTPTYPGLALREQVYTALTVAFEVSSPCWLFLLN